MFVYSRDLLDDVKIEESWEKSLKIVWCRFKTYRPVASFTKGVNPRLDKRPSKTNGRLANLVLTSLVKEAHGICSSLFPVAHS